VSYSQHKSCPQLEELIQVLVTAYPEACSEPDELGRLPLHEVIAWKASLNIISIIFMAYPQALFERDSSGWLPLERNALVDRPDRQDVEKLFFDGYRIWEQCQTEAILRFQLSKNSITSVNHTKDSILSLAQVLALSKEETGLVSMDDKSIVLHDEDTLVHTQKVLQDIYSRNLVLVNAVDTLSRESMQLHEQRTRDKSRMYDLEDEIADLNSKLRRREIVFHDLGFDASGNNFSNVKLIKEQAMSMMSMDPEPPTVLTKYLETKVGELSEENDQLE